MQSRYGQGKAERISFSSALLLTIFSSRENFNVIFMVPQQQWMWGCLYGRFEFGRSLHGKVGGSTGGSGAQLEAQWSITARGSPFQEGSSHMSTSQFQTSNSQRKICRLGKRSSVISDGCNSIKVVLWVLSEVWSTLRFWKTMCVIIVQCLRLTPLTCIL